MHECLLCEKDMKKSKNTFGNGCINHIINFLDITKPKRIKDKEQLLYKNVMKQTNIKSINKNQQIWLTDRYLTFKYLNELHYGNYDEIKNEINEDINNIKKVKKMADLKTERKIRLKEVYDLYKKERKFEEKIKELKSGKIDDSEKIKALITGFSFIFNMSKNKTQYEKSNFKAMQYAFWQTVIEVGGKYVDFKISADLLQHSLENNPEDLHITEGFVIEEIKRDEQFKKLIGNLVEVNKDKESFSYNKKIIWR